MEIYIDILKQMNFKKINNAIVLSLLKNNKLNVDIEFYNQGPIIIDDNTICSLCEKKINLSAFFIYKKNIFFHYYCYNKLTNI